LLIRVVDSVFFFKCLPCATTFVLDWSEKGKKAIVSLARYCNKHTMGTAASSASTALSTSILPGGFKGWLVGTSSTLGTTGAFAGLIGNDDSQYLLTSSDGAPLYTPDQLTNRLPSAGGLLCSISFQTGLVNQHVLRFTPDRLPVTIVTSTYTGSSPPTPNTLTWNAGDNQIITGISFVSTPSGFLTTTTGGTILLQGTPHFGPLPTPTSQPPATTTNTPPVTTYTPPRPLRHRPLLLPRQCCWYLSSWSSWLLRVRVPTFI
jgi:hypothetical protein